MLDVCCAGHQTQGFTYARQAFYWRSHILTQRLPCLIQCLDFWRSSVQLFLYPCWGETLGMHENIPYRWNSFLRLWPLSVKIWESAVSVHFNLALALDDAIFIWPSEYYFHNLASLPFNLSHLLPINRFKKNNMLNLINNFCVFNWGDTCVSQVTF